MGEVIVAAIPSNDDYVWRLSSEKVPHLTMLYLGEVSDEAVLQRMSEFVEHASDLMLHKFGLEVERRGKLGPDDADVLFFGDYCIKWLEDFRSALLANKEILDAYNSADQYPQWTPHLTMGYPAAPAKIDTRDYAGVSWVNFDRIALWDGEYEGPMYELKSASSRYAQLAMSDPAEYAMIHFGVKGMRWGVRRSKSESAGSSHEHPDSEEVTKAKATSAKIAANHGKTDGIDSHDLRHLVDRMGLEQRYSKILAERDAAEKGSPTSIKAKTKDFLDTIKTVNELDRVLGNPLAKSLGKVIAKKGTKYAAKGAAKGAKYTAKAAGKGVVYVSKDLARRATT